MVTVRTHTRQDAGLVLGELLLVVALALAMVVGGVVVARSQDRAAAVESVRHDVEQTTPYVTVAMGLKPPTSFTFYGQDATGFVALAPPFLSQSAGNRLVIGHPGGPGTFVIAGAHRTGSSFCYDSVTGTSGDDPSICQGLDVVAADQAQAIAAAINIAPGWLEPCFSGFQSAYAQGWDVGSWEVTAAAPFVVAPPPYFGFPLGACAEQYERGYRAARSGGTFSP